jgi:flagellar hook-associated protein 3
MTLRVTPDIVVSQALRHARQHNANLANLQAQVSTGLRVQRPSDDPVAIRQILTERATEERLESQIAGIQTVRSKLNLSVSQLLEANKILVRAKEIALEANQPIDDGTRKISAQEVSQLLDRLLAIANTQDDGTYLYSGTSHDVAPFAVASDGSASTVSYLGAEIRAQTVLSTVLSLDHLYTGSEVFQQRDRQDTLLIGQTGAATGSGTDSATGSGTLVVRHTLTKYANGSGIQRGNSSTDGDTIIGPNGLHKVTIVDTSGTGAFGTVSINGGPAIAFADSDTDLKVVGHGGETIYVNTTAITPGFSGDIVMTAEGTLSVDGGNTEIPIDFSNNQVVLHGSTGKVTNVDSATITRVGVEHAEYTGTADVFQALAELRDDLLGARQFSDPEWTESISRRIADLDRVRDDVLQVVGEQSVTLQNLDALENNLRNVQLETQRILSDLESADLAEVTLRLQQEQTLLQFSFASFAAVTDTNLLDFLR